MTLAQVFPGMVWGAMMAPVALVALLAGIVSIVLRKTLTGLLFGVVATVLAIVAPTVYLIGADGDGTMTGAVIFATPAVLGLTGMILYVRARNSGDNHRLQLTGDARDGE